MTACRRRAVLAAGCAFMLLGPAPGLSLGAQTQIDLPAALEVRGLGVGRRLSPATGWIGYRHALLPSGQRLRLSVRAEGLGERSGISAVSFTTSHARGGVGLRGRLAGPEFVPVFESHPLAVSGGAEVAWTIETSGAVRAAGRHDLVLRWRVEVIAGPEAAPPPLPSPATGSAGRTGAGERPAASVLPRPDYSRPFTYPGLGDQGPP